MRLTMADGGATAQTHRSGPRFTTVLVPDGDRFIDASATKRVVTEGEEVLMVASR